MMDGAFQPSNTMSAYARSCTTRMSCCLASATTRSKNSSSTHCAVGIDLHAIAIAVPARDRTPQPRNAFGRGVTVRLRPLRHLCELGHDVWRGGPVRVAHAHVDDVFAAAPCGHAQFGSDVEDVRG